MLRQSQMKTLTKKMNDAAGLAILFAMAFAFFTYSTYHFFFDGGYFGGQVIDINAYGFFFGLLAFGSFLTSLAFSIRANALQQKLKR